MTKLTVRKLLIATVVVAILTAWQLHCRNLRLRDDIVIEELKALHSSLKLVGIIRVVDSNSPTVPFEANCTWYVTRQKSFIGGLMPSLLMPEYHEFVTKISFLDRSDELLMVAAKFEKLEEILIWDRASLESDAGRLLLTRHPQIKIEFVSNN